jgi:hypothetical protein
MSTVEVTRDDGGYTAIDTATGSLGEGTTYADALEDLARNLRDHEPESEMFDAKSAYESASATVRARFEEKGIDENEVEDAIKWARSG